MDKGHNSFGQSASHEDAGLKHAKDNKLSAATVCAHWGWD